MKSSIFHHMHKPLLGALSLLLVFTPPVARSSPAPALLDARLVTEAHQRYQRQKFGLFVHYVPTLTVDPKPTNRCATSTSWRRIRCRAVRPGRGRFRRRVCHLHRPSFQRPHALPERGEQALAGRPPQARQHPREELEDLLGHRCHRPSRHRAEGKKHRPAPLRASRRWPRLQPRGPGNTGWFECATGHVTWNNFQNELFDELCQRYGTRIQGLWFDGMYVHNDGSGSWHGCIDQPRFRKSLLKHNPALILTANVSGAREKNPNPDWVAADYRAWEVSDVSGWLGLTGVNPAAKQDDAFTWPGTKEQVALVIAGNWWATNKNNNARFSADDLYRYLVLQASVSDSGGLAISAGCFPGTVAEQPNGTIWEGNFRERMIELNKRVAPVAESIKNTNASKAFVTEDHQWLEQKGWGVATDSPDGSVTYLHVLRPPDSQSLAIGKPADGAEFRSASLLPAGTQVALQGDAASGYTISLPDGTSWHPLDTVIRLEADPAVMQRRLAAVRESLASELATLKSKGDRNSKTFWSSGDKTRKPTTRKKSRSTSVRKISSASFVSPRDKWGAARVSQSISTSTAPPTANPGPPCAPSRTPHSQTPEIHSVSYFPPPSALPPNPGHPPPRHVRRQRFLPHAVVGHRGLPARRIIGDFSAKNPPPGLIPGAMLESKSTNGDGIPENDPLES